MKFGNMDLNYVKFVFMGKYRGQHSPVDSHCLDLSHFLLFQTLTAMVVGRVCPAASSVSTVCVSRATWVSSVRIQHVRVTPVSMGGSVASQERATSVAVHNPGPVSTVRWVRQTGAHSV